MRSPKIDGRTKQELTKHLEEKVHELTGWQPDPVGSADAGAALIRVFARFAELIVERINLLPEKNFLAFLNLIGADVAAPQSARVPLTFTLADNSPIDGLVPRGTQAAAPLLEGEEDEVVFETTRELVLTRSQLTAVFARQPAIASDTFDNCTAAATKPDKTSFTVFSADHPISHALYLGSAALAKLPEPTDVTVILHGEAAELSKFGQLMLKWHYWNGESWQRFPPDRVVLATPAIEQWSITLKGLPAVPTSEVNGQQSSWLRLQPAFALPAERADLLLEAFGTGSRRPESSTFPYYPFGPDGDKASFYLNGETVFGRPGALARLEVRMATIGTVGNNVIWEYMHTTGNDTKMWRPLTVVDGTRAFTEDGVILIHIPADGSWNVSLHHSWSGRWLRATVDSTYGQVPRIAAIAAALDWDLPHIRHVAMRLPGGPLTLPPAEGFLNRLELDLSKDFYPFGEQPRFNDTLYLALTEALTAAEVKPGDVVSLKINLSTPGSAGGSGTPANSDKKVRLLWEFWNGRSWQELGSASESRPFTGVTDFAFNDTTLAFTTSGNLQFKLPTTMAANTVNGLPGVWLRTRLTTGHYGREAGYEPYEINIEGNKITAYRLVPANYAPPIIGSLAINVSSKKEILVNHCLTLNDFVYTDFSAANSANKPFTPFTSTSDQEPTLYLGFDRPFAKRSVTLYAAVAPPSPDNVVVGKFRLAAEQTPPRLVWEYATTASSWGRLAVQDETNNFSERGLIRFTGPAAFSPRQLFGQTCYWLRVRWLAGGFAVPPHLRFLLTNTTWAEQAQLVRDETLGSSNGNPAQVFQLAQHPVLPGQVVVIRESDLSARELARIRAVNRAADIPIEQDSAGNLEDIWVTWKDVIDFYGSAASDRHYTLDRLTGELRFGDGQRGLIPPQGQNNIRVAQYRSGGGVQGNRDQKTIVQLKSSIPYVAAVINHEDAAGGADQQPIEQVKRYGPRRLRHRDRAVTVKDVEDLAFAASSAVARARAIPPRFRPMDLWLQPKPRKAPAALPDHERAQGGNMGLLIVPQSSSPRPTASPALLAQVRQYLLTRCPAVANLWVSSPNWVEVKVTTIVVPTSIESSDAVGEAVRAALSRYLHPLTGGPRGQGWSFGRRPYHSDLYALIEGIFGVDHVRQVLIDDTPDMSTLRQVEQYLIFSGQHSVTVLNPPHAQ